MTREERELLRLYRMLPARERGSLIDYAGYLAEQAGNEPTLVAEKVPIPRPSEESVVAAIKRLTATYPMLEPEQLLNDTAGLMTQHVTQGRSAVEVIDELERMFLSAYEDAETE